MPGISTNGNVVPGVASFTSIAPVQFDVVAGAAGYVDTDISAAVPTGFKVALIRYYSAGATASGVRPIGSAINTFTSYGAFATNHVMVNVAAGRAELYRNATDTASYIVMGYLS